MKSTAPGADPYLAVTILTAGVYLTVRGLDNIHQGMKDHDERAATDETPDKPDPVAQVLCQTRNSGNDCFEGKVVRLLFWK